MADELVTDAPADTSAPLPAVEGGDLPPIAPAAEQPPPAPAEPAKPESRRDTLAREFKTPTNRGRHAAFQPREAGKFAGAPVMPPAAPAAPQPVLELPKSLRRELQPHWEKSPAEIRQAIIQREADQEAFIGKHRTTMDQANAVLQQFQPYEWLLRNEGATPAAAIGPLLQTAAILRTGTPQAKAQQVLGVMQKYGIPMEDVQALMGNGESTVTDPNYNRLAQQVQHLTQTFTQERQQQEQQSNQRALTVIEQFSADPANQYFPQVADKMTALLQAPHLLGQDVQFLSERERLKLAYDTALRLDPTLSAQVTAQQQAAAAHQQRVQAQQAANTAKAAAQQVRGAPGTPLQAAVNVNDRRSVIANALRAAQA